MKKYFAKFNSTPINAFHPRTVWMAVGSTTTYEEKLAISLPMDEMPDWALAEYTNWTVEFVPDLPTGRLV